MTDIRHPPHAFLTTREAAKVLGISTRTAQLWVEKGFLEAWKTEGGHRRISRTSVEHMLAGKLPCPSPKETLTPKKYDQTGNLKILIAEDDVTLLKLYTTAINSWKLPLEIITGKNGIEALVQIGRHAPSILIIDLCMPGMDGIQLIRSMSASDWASGMDILVVTGIDRSEINALGGLPGGIRIFPKPVPFDELHSIIYEALEQHIAC